jgi:hypothetical protein
MITLYPLKYNDYYNYYKLLDFKLNETSLLLNINGTFANQNINKNIQLNKNAFITSQTVINSSLTALYTYLLVDLNSYTYASNNITFNSTEPHKPEFLLYFNSNYVCINDYVASVTSSSQSAGTGGGSGSGSSGGSGSGSGGGSGSGSSGGSGSGSGGESGSGSSGGSGSGSGGESGSGTSTSGSTTTSSTDLNLVTVRYTDTGVPIYENSFPKKIAELIEKESITLPYTRLFAGTNFPTNAQNYDTFYNIDTSRYYLYSDSAWYYFNWLSLSTYRYMFSNTNCCSIYVFNRSTTKITFKSLFSYTLPNSQTNAFVIPLIAKNTTVMDDSYLYYFNFYYPYANVRYHVTQTNATKCIGINAYVNMQIPPRPYESNSYLTLFGFLQNSLLYIDTSCTIDVYDVSSSRWNLTIVTNIPFIPIHKYSNSFSASKLSFNLTPNVYIKEIDDMHISYWNYTTTVIYPYTSSSFVFLVFPYNESYTGLISTNSITIISATVPLITYLPY